MCSHLLFLPQYFSCFVTFRFMHLIFRSCVRSGRFLVAGRVRDCGVEFTSVLWKVHHPAAWKLLTEITATEGNKSLALTTLVLAGHRVSNVTCRLLGHDQAETLFRNMSVCLAVSVWMSLIGRIVFLCHQCDIMLKVNYGHDAMNRELNRGIKNKNKNPAN